MVGFLDFSGQLAVYKSYHFNKVNVAIHLVCIPILIATMSFALSTVNILESQHANVGMLFGISYGIYYILLDWKAGIPAAIGLILWEYFGRIFYDGLLEKGPNVGFNGLLAAFVGTTSGLTKGELLKWVLGLHVTAWLAQFYGHGVHEGRAPALVDNLLQAVVLAPFFVLFEALFFLGYRRDIEKSMLNTAGVLRREYINDKKKL